MEFSSVWLAKTLPNYQGAVDLGITINEVSIDASQSMNNGLFVSVETRDNGDKSDLLKKAISNGAIAAIWDKQWPVPDFLPTDFPLFFVEDTEFALKELAEAYVGEVNPKMICVTGVKGTSMTKRWITSILSQHFDVFQPDNLVISEVELSLCLLRMPHKAKACVVEFGLNDEGEMQDLSHLSQPDIGVITNVSHNGGSTDLIQKSVEIFAGLKENGFVILDGDQPEYAPLYKKGNVLTCGFHEKNNSLLVHVGSSSENTQFTLNNEAYTIRTRTSDKSIVRFAGYAVMVGKTLGLGQVSIQTGLSTVISNDQPHDFSSTDQK